jgi:hypothetical protein
LDPFLVTRNTAGFVLHEVEDVEGLQGSIREKAVYRLLLIIEKLEGDATATTTTTFRMVLMLEAMGM